jgi:hypothetical protein
MKETFVRVIHWLPRIICILAILFISVFAFDVFEPGLTFWQQMGALFMHLIPSFILLALLVVSWKWELIGGIIFTLIGLAFSPFIFLHNYRMNHSVWMSIGILFAINMPFVLVGVLFMVSHHQKKKNLP